MSAPEDTPTKPSMQVERRLLERARQDWQPDPELVRECAGVFEFYGGDFGPLGEDVVRRVLSAAAAWHARKDAEERAHARRRGDLELVARVQEYVGGNGPMSASLPLRDALEDALMHATRLHRALPDGRTRDVAEQTCLCLLKQIRELDHELVIEARWPAVEA